MIPYAARGALLSADGRYRYRLWRVWGLDTTNAVLFLMLNPSTADGETDDATIRRCVGYARRWGHDALDVANLFAFRATHPKDLLAAPEPVGPDNDRHLLDLARRAKRVVCAWGPHGHHQGRGELVLERLRSAGVTPLCLVRTKDGSPGHPLRLRADLLPVPMTECGVLHSPQNLSGCGE